MYKVILKVLLFTILAQTVLVGCASDQQQKSKIDLNIVYSSRIDFRNDYGHAMDTHFPDVNVNIIEFNTILGAEVRNGLEYQPMSGEAWNYGRYVDSVKSNNADILFFPAALYSKMIDDGLLKDMTIYSDDSELLGIDSMFIDAWLAMGNGRLYFASTSYIPQALYYNVDLFNELNLSFPINGLGWDELLKQATLLSVVMGEYEKYGFSASNYGPAELLLQIGRDKGLSWYDEVNQKIMLSNENWKPIVDQLITIFSTQSNIYNEGKMDKHLFLEGRLAMLLSDYSVANELDYSNSEINWNVVTAPYVEFNTQASSLSSFPFLNGIAQSSSQPEEAIKVWKFLNSESLAKQHFYADYYKVDMPVRSNILSSRSQQEKIEPFYSLLPSVSLYKQNELISSRIKKEVLRFLDLEFYKLKPGGDRLSDDMLSEWEQEVEKIINGR